MRQYRVGITFRGGDHVTVDDVRVAHPTGQVLTIWYLNGTVEFHPFDLIEAVAVFDDGEVEGEAEHGDG